METNPLINLSLRISYGTLKDNAQKVHDGFVSHILEYPVPNPTMIIFQDDIDDLSQAIADWGPKGARGSREQHLSLMDKAEQVRVDYRQLAQYAMNTKPGNKLSWVSLGFSVRRPKTKPAVLEAVQDFHRFISRSLGEGKIKLKWKRPLDASSSNVKSYVIQASTIGIQPMLPDGHVVVNNGIIAVVPNTSIIFEPPFTGSNYFWVTPLNSLGYGVSSAVVFYNKPAVI